MIRQNLYRPADLASMAVRPLPPQGQQDAKEEIFEGEL